MGGQRQVERGVQDQQDGGGRRHDGAADGKPRRRCCVHMANKREIQKHEMKVGREKSGSWFELAAGGLEASGTDCTMGTHGSFPIGLISNWARF